MAMIPGYENLKSGYLDIQDVLVWRVDLEYRQGNSDKVYLAIIVANGGTFKVYGLYGRRGQKLRTEGKGSFASLDQAKITANNLVRMKTSAGRQDPYTEVFRAETQAALPVAASASQTVPPSKSKPKNPNPTGSAQTPNFPTKLSAVMTYKHPAYDAVAPHQLKPYMTTDEYVMMHFIKYEPYIFFLHKEGIIIYSRITGDVHKQTPYPAEFPLARATPFMGCCFEGVEVSAGRYAITDLLRIMEYGKVIRDINTFAWHQRRGMLDFIFDEIMPPRVDPYDDTRSIHLHEYQIKTKEERYNNLQKGTKIILRNVNFTTEGVVQTSTK